MRRDETPAVGPRRRGPRLPLAATLALAAALHGPPARGHVAHDPVVQAAVAPDFPTSGRIVGVFKDDDNVVWTLSRDGGRSFAFHGDEVVDGSVPVVAFGSPLVLWAARDGADAFRSDDRGETWARVGAGSDAAATAILAPGPDDCFLGTREGLLVTADGGASWRSHLDGVEVRVLAISPDFGSDGVAFAGGGDGRVYRSDDGGASWAVVSVPASVAVLALALSPSFASDATLWIGTEGEGAYRSGDGGETFEPLPSLDDPADDPDLLGVVPALATGAGELYAATALRGALRSEDGGETFEPRDDGIEEAAYGGPGGVPEGGWHFSGLSVLDAAGGESWVMLVSWGGLYLSGDRGETWYQTQQAGQEYVRAARFSGDGSDVLWYGIYGGGVARHDLATGEVLVSNVGLTDPWVRSVVASPAVEDDGIVLVLTATGYFRSGDGGTSFTRTDGLPISNPHWMFLSPTFADDRRAYLLGSGGAAGIAVSTDAGATFRTPSLAGSGEGQAARDLSFSPEFETDRTVFAVISRGGGVVRSLDAGDTWTALGSQGWGDVSGVEAVPDGGGFHLVVASPDAGLLRSEDGGEHFERVTDGVPDGVEALGLVRTRDGSLFAATKLHGVLRSHDGGRSWEAAPGFPGCEMIVGLFASDADSLSDSAVIAGTYHGAWISGDGGGAFTLATPLMRIEAEHPQWIRSPEWREVAARDGESAAAVMETSAAGATAWTLAKGGELAVRATVGPDRGGFCLSVDGVPRALCETAAEAAAAQRAVCGVSGLGDGWHEVAIRTLGDGQVDLDAVDARRPDGLTYGSGADECAPFELGPGPTLSLPPVVPPLGTDPADPCGLAEGSADDDDDDDSSADGGGPGGFGVRGEHGPGGGDGEPGEGGKDDPDVLVGGERGGEVSVPGCGCSGGGAGAAGWVGPVLLGIRVLSRRPRGGRRSG
ncbi:hypothetical protein L6R50_23805 [Myxococcota bacterium]|nr:hypothetical protein [Myxococcota bacterium]